MSETSTEDEATDGDPLIGTLLDDRYRILRRLGQGGMGLVYEALHEVLKSRLAIKVLRSEAAADKESLERLEREAQSASAIGNEHIVDVRDFGRLPDGSTYVVMELIDGADLYREVRRGPLEWRRAASIATQICEALHAAHARGIVHRDLKAENVILTTKRGEADFVKIVDFGIAKVQGGAKITVAGRVMGTPEYMSPEQCTGTTVDHRTDIYSLGVLMYEMVTGKLPFADPNLTALIRKQMREAPVAPSRVRPEAELPLGLEAIILRCLAKDPGGRFPSMRAVALELAALEPTVARWIKTDAASGEPGLESGAPGPAVPMGLLPTMLGDTLEAPNMEPTPAAITVDAEVRRSPTLLVGIAVAAIAAGVVAGLYFAQSAPTDDGTASALAADEGGGGAAVASVPGTSGVQGTLVQGTGVQGVADAGTSAAAAHADGLREQLVLETEPSAARVFEGEALLGETPLSLRRPAGQERLDLTVRHAGYEDAALVLSALSQARLRLVLQPSAPRPRGSSPHDGADNAEQPARPSRTTPRTGGQFLDPWN